MLQKPHRKTLAQLASNVLWRVNRLSAHGNRTYIPYWVLFHRSILQLLLMLQLVPSHQTHPIYSNQTSLFLLTNDHLISQAPEEKGNINTKLVSKGNNRLNLVPILRFRTLYKQSKADTAAPLDVHTVPTCMTIRKFLLTGSVSLLESVKRTLTVD